MTWLAEGLKMPDRYVRMADRGDVGSVSTRP